MQALDAVNDRSGGGVLKAASGKVGAAPQPEFRVQRGQEASKGESSAAQPQVSREVAKGLPYPPRTWGRFGSDVEPGGAAYGR